jgi:hypothetical protein
MHIIFPTPRAARIPRGGRGAVVALTALASAALMSACGSSSSSSSGASKTNLNTTRVLSERHIHATVVCPAVVPQVKGRTFECIATSRSTVAPHNIVKTPFLVTIQTARGYVTYVGK